MLTIVGIVAFAIVVGMIRTFGVDRRESTSEAAAAFSYNNPVAINESTVRIGSLEWQLAPALGLMDWQTAKTYCETLTLAGGGWRLPSTDELKSLYDSKPRGNAANPPLDFAAYWSSAPVKYNNDLSALLINFRNGSTDIERMSDYYAVRCVR
jgi:hypothetical protein